MTTRRDFLQRAALASAASFALPASADATPRSLRDDRAVAVLPPPPIGSPEMVAQDESYWRDVARQYEVTDATTNLEAGYWG